MTITADGWANKGGTSTRSCKCGTWKKHWINDSGKSWPNDCSKKGCTATPVLGAHIYNNDVSGEKIVPFCDSCNKLDGKFSLNGGVTLVSANKSNSCEA
jgi:hypothetical protein